MSQRMPSHCPAISADGLDHRLPQPRLKGVELKHIGPGREVGIPAAGKHLSSRLDERRRIVARIVSVPLNEVFRMIVDPWMVWRHVVRDKIEDEAQPALTEHGSRGGESLRPAEVIVNDVAAHTVGRADIVLRHKVGEGSPEILEEPLVSHGDFDAGRAALPDPHEPHGVEATGGDLIPLLRRHRGKIHGPLVFPAQITQPDPGVDFVDDGMPRPRAHRFYFLGVGAQGEDGLLASFQGGLRIKKTIGIFTVAI